MGKKALLRRFMKKMVIKKNPHDGLRSPHKPTKAHRNLKKYFRKHKHKKNYLETS